MCRKFHTHTLFIVTCICSERQRFSTSRLRTYTKYRSENSKEKIVFKMAFFLVTPVLFLLWQLKMSVMKKACDVDHSHPENDTMMHRNDLFSHFRVLGGKHSSECTLILTEGDSAKSLAVSGLGVIGRDRYGVFPLRGKILNVREATHKQVWDGRESINEYITCRLWKKESNTMLKSSCKTVVTTFCLQLQRWVMLDWVSLSFNSDHWYFTEWLHEAII